MCRWYCSNLPNGTSTQPSTTEQPKTAKLRPANPSSEPDRYRIRPADVTEDRYMILLTSQKVVPVPAP